MNRIDKKVMSYLNRSLEIIHSFNKTLTKESGIVTDADSNLVEIAQLIQTQELKNRDIKIGSGSYSIEELRNSLETIKP